MLLLAYGGFQSTTYWGAFNETFPIFMGCLIPPVVFYLGCSLGIEHIRQRSLVVLVFLLFGLIYQGTMGATGSIGPAHVAVGVGVWVCPVFLIVLWVKATLLWAFDLRTRWHLRRHAAKGEETPVDSTSSPLLCLLILGTSFALTAITFYAFRYDMSTQVIALVLLGDLLFLPGWIWAISMVRHRRGHMRMEHP